MRREDMDLVRDYVRSHSESAFEEIVSRHVNLVYSTAMRQMRDPHTAEEITQTVFILLAGKAASLNSQTILPGWLHRAAVLTARDVRKKRSRGFQREQRAFMESQSQSSAPDPDWELISPLLDEALVQLGEKDRQAVLLHYFQRKTFADVGICLRMTEDTARRRTNRALEKLRKILSSLGVRSTATVLAGTISANSIQIAPVVLTKSVAAAAAAHGVAAGGSTLPILNSILKIMASTKLKAAIVSGVLLATTATIIVVQHKRPRPFVPVAIDKSSFVNAGHRTPEKTLQTMLWAMTEGDTEAYLDCCTPEERARREKQWAGLSPDQLAAKGKNQVTSVLGIRILNLTNISKDQVVVTAWVEGKGGTQTMQFDKVGNEWKFAQEAH